MGDVAVLRHGRPDQGRSGRNEWWVETRDGYPLTGGQRDRIAALAEARARGLRVVGTRGCVIYDDHSGAHVCTCTEVVRYDDEDGLPLDAEYEATVTADPGSATESGSYLYVCGRCGASCWSGL